MTVNKILAKPIELKEANKYVSENHRHHQPVYRDKYRLACVDEKGVLHGVIQVGRPVSRYLDDGETLEVVRCCTDGTINACSFLYSKAAKIAKEMGYKKIITYILESELGTSLKASGWKLAKEKVGGGSWDRPSRRRVQKAPTCKKKRYEKILNI